MDNESTPTPNMEPTSPEHQPPQAELPETMPPELSEALLKELPPGQREVARVRAEAIWYGFRTGLGEAFTKNGLWAESATGISEALVSGADATSKSREYFHHFGQVNAAHGMDRSDRPIVLEFLLATEADPQAASKLAIERTKKLTPEDRPYIEQVLGLMDREKYTALGFQQVQTELRERGVTIDYEDIEEVAFGLLHDKGHAAERNLDRLLKVGVTIEQVRAVLRFVRAMELEGVVNQLVHENRDSQLIFGARPVDNLV